MNGLQVAPTISMGEWFQDRAEGMLRGVPSNQSPIVTFDLAGPKNGGKGYYAWDKNNFAPRVAVAWTPHATSGFLGTLTGGDKMVIRGGYSKVFDRIGQGLALNFDSGFAFGMSTSISSPFGLAVRAEPGGPVRQHVHAAADPAGGAAWRVPADTAATRRHHYDEHRRHAGHAVGAHAQRARRARAAGRLRHRGRVRRALRARPADSARYRDAVEPGGHEVGDGLLHGDPDPDPSDPGCGHSRGRRLLGLRRRAQHGVLGESVPRRGGQRHQRHAGDRTSVQPERTRLHHGALRHGRVVLAVVQHLRPLRVFCRPVPIRWHRSARWAGRITTR